MASESDVASEIEVLQSIYLDELQVDRTDAGCWQVRLVLHPSTAQDAVSQFVRLTLRLTLDQKYPSSPPSISIHNPRGLSDDKIHSVECSLRAEAEAGVGSPVLYQLIEKAKEMLTESNVPHGNCVICLYDFKEAETLTRTRCYHHFHSHCLGRYVQHSEQELERRQKELQEDKTRDHAHRQELSVVCPVCREPLNYDVSQLLSCPAPLLPEVDDTGMSSDFQRKWNELQKILDKQRMNGGIIDPEEESNRFLIHIQAPTASETPDADVTSDLPSPPLHDPGLPSMHQCRGDAHRSRRPGPRRWGRARPVADQLHGLTLCPDAKHGPPPAHARLSEDPDHAAAEGRRRAPHHHQHHHQARHHRCRGGKGRGSRPVERERNREEVL